MDRWTTIAIWLITIMVAILLLDWLSLRVERELYSVEYRLGNVERKLERIEGQPDYN